MEDSNLVLSLAILLAAALVGGMIAHRFRQPLILGYIVIGAAIGPYSLGLVGDPALVESVATVGVALLMFTLGLEVSVGQLRQVGRVGLWGGILQVALTAGIGLGAGLIIFDWPFTQAVVFGLCVSLSSTMVCLKVLLDRGELDSAHGRIMMAILILQDIAVVLLVVIESLLGQEGDSWLVTLGMSLGKAALFVVVTVIAGRWIIPWLLGRVGGVEARELFLLTLIVLCLGAVLGTTFLGLSVIFGAFIIGLVLRESRFASQALAEVTPLRDVFATLFFVSLGMLLDLRFVLDNWEQVLIAVVVVAFVKITVVFGLVRLFGYNVRVAGFVGLGLFQIGEFSFILAQNGVRMDIVSQDFYSLIVASAIITMLLTPLALVLASRLYPRYVRMMEGRGGIVAAELVATAPVVPSPDTVLIAGYGRVGQNVAKGLQEAGVPYTVVELDPEVVTKLRCEKVSCLYGDASNVHVLSQVDMRKIKALVVTYPDPLAVRATIQGALKINPKLRVLARVHRGEDIRQISSLGDVEMINPEFEAGVELVKRILSAEGWEESDIEKASEKLRQEHKIAGIVTGEET